MSQPKRKSLAELKADAEVGRPEATHDLCVAGKLNVERERLQTEIYEEAETAKRAEQSGRLGTKSKLNKLNAEHEKLIEQMSEYLVTIRFRAKPAHEWRVWRTANPARDGDDLDDQVGYNVDALSASLREFVVSVNDEPLTDEWWALITDAMAPGDEWRMTSRVIGLHSGVNAVPKSLTESLKNLRSDDDSKSPERGA